jgi:hypothetical protein
VTDVASRPTFYRASRSRLPLFAAGITAVQNIDFQGTSFMVDSYDSGSPFHSTNGMYWPSNRLAGGDLSCLSGLMNIGNASVFGHLTLGPGAAHSLGPLGTVGDLNWAGPGIQPGSVTNDYRFCLPDVAVPYTSGSALPAPKLGVINLGSSNYLISGNFIMQSNDVLEVDGANARFFVTGSFSMDPASLILITNGGLLRLYVGYDSGPATNSTLTRVTTSGNASTFQYYGLPTITNLTWKGVTPYIGIIYAPRATFAIGSPSAPTSDYQGAVAAGSMILKGELGFHFDEYLKRGGPTR